MVILHKLPRGLHRKPWWTSFFPRLQIRTGTVSFHSAFYHYFPFTFANEYCSFSLVIIGKFDYCSIRKAQIEKVKNVLVEKDKEN